MIALYLLKLVGTSLTLDFVSPPYAMREGERLRERERETMYIALHCIPITTSRFKMQKLQNFDFKNFDFKTWRPLQGKKKKSCLVQELGNPDPNTNNEGCRTKDEEQRTENEE